jgi:hypothetical protein
MTDDTLLPFDLPAVRRKKLTVDFEGACPAQRDRVTPRTAGAATAPLGALER